MDSTQRQNLSIGLTYAVRHLNISFKASRLIYGSAWGTQANGDSHEAHHSRIDDTLKTNNIYTPIGSETQISGTALAYIYRTNNLIDTLINPAKNGRGDWTPTRSLVGKLLDDMEREVKQLLLPTGQMVSATRQGFMEWKWDASQDQWYY